MKLYLLVMVALLSTITATNVWGQAFTGTITGLVQDPNAAAIPGVDVRIRNEATNDVRNTKSGGDGAFIFSQIPPGKYEISAETQGFRRSLQTGVELRVNQTLEVNLALRWARSVRP